MIPVVQLDPSTLTIWFDPELVGHMPGDIPVGSAVQYSLWGDLDALHELVDGAALDSNRVRAIHLASAVWHEQRHFLDLLLTNHGAFRVRRFLMTYYHLESVLSLALEEGGGMIWCPLSVYDDEVEREVLAIETDSEQLRKIARDMAVRAEMTRDDRSVFALRRGPTELGGDAQLEALAWMFQHVAVRRHFGVEAERRVQSDLGRSQRENRLYSWAITLVDDFGLGLVERADEETRIVDISLLVPMIYGALASRRWGQKQVETQEHASGFPLARLAGLVRALRGKGPSVLGDTADAWRLVNETAADLWGRSVIEEIRADLEFEAEFVQTVESTEVAFEYAKGVISDYHGLRARLVELLEKDPLPFLDPDSYVDTLLERVRPLPVIARPGGEVGEPEPGLERLLGYNDPDSDAPSSRWWWAAYPTDWPWGDPDLVVLGERTAWIRAADSLAPLTKLLFHGRRHRIMLGPELLSMEGRLAADGYNVRVHGAFSSPDDLEDAAFYFDLTGKPEAVCDICRRKLTRETAFALSPWLFRRDEAASRIALRLGGPGEEGRLRATRDWSIWLVCSTCHENVERRDEAAVMARAFG
jgi:hypothetical protein